MEEYEGLFPLLKSSMLAYILALKVTFTCWLRLPLIYVYKHCAYD